MKKLIFLGVLVALSLGSCNSRSADTHDGHNHETENHDHEAELHEEADEHGGHNHESEEAHSAGSGEIVLPPAKAKAAGVEVNTVEPGTFHQVIKTSGQVLAAQGDESVAVATVAGVVSFRNKNVVEGMQVGKGSPLLTLSSQNMAEGDPVQKARIAYEVSKKEYERMKALVASKIVSEKEFAQAKQAYENARISYEAVARNHTPQGQTVTAPIGGYVKSLLVKEGDYVSVGQPLVSITQNRRLFLRADVSEKYYNALPSVASANFSTPYNNKVYSLTDLNGRLLSYGKASGEGSYYIPVTFEFDNKGEVVPGSFVEIYLLTKPMEGVISVPRSALTEEQGSFFVYLQIDDECYRKQLVTLGADDGERVQVLTGLHAGDRLVTKGAYQVKLAGATNAIPAHSHEH